jgi:16S rRNA processing protein RimM
MSQRPTLEVGYVARAHGIHGELAVRTFDPESEALTLVRRIVLRNRAGDERPIDIEEVRRMTGAVLLKLVGVGSRSEAEALRGCTVLVHREDLPPPAEGEWFQGDLVGLVAFTPEGARLGPVREIWNTGPVPNLVIETEGPEPLVVPFVDDFVPEVDVPGGRLVVRPPEMLK